MGGPFTKDEDLETFCTNAKDAKAAGKIRKDGQKRLKMEMKFARELSKTLPKNDPIFRMQVTLPNKKRRDKNLEDLQHR